MDWFKRAMKRLFERSQPVWSNSGYPLVVEAAPKAQPKKRTKKARKKK